MAFATNSTDHLVRSNVFSSQIKEVIEDELLGMQWVDMLSDFPDGDTFNIPSLGQYIANDYSEGNAVQYQGPDTGNFTFVLSDYVESSTFITEKMKQDSMWMSRVLASIPAGQSRAIMERIEQDVLAIGPDTQTASDTNTINGAYHRFVGGGTSEVIELADFAKAAYALKKANISSSNRIAIVDPSVEMTLNTLTGITNTVNNPKWEGLISTGHTLGGMRFLNNIYGFDVYVSDHLKTSVNETIDSLTTAAGVANIFFSADQDILPFVGAMRQAPKVDSEFNKDLQREEYVTTARWGFGLIRPENLVTVLTDTDQVYA